MILIIAEKPSLANDIASALPGTKQKNGDEYVDPSTGTPSYTLTGYDCLAPFTEESIISYDN